MHLESLRRPGIDWDESWKKLGAFFSEERLRMEGTAERDPDHAVPDARTGQDGAMYRLRGSRRDYVPYEKWYQCPGGCVRVQSMKDIHSLELWTVSVFPSEPECRTIWGEVREDAFTSWWETYDRDAADRYLSRLLDRLGGCLPEVKRKKKRRPALRG